MMFFNRRRGGKWGIAYGVLNTRGGQLRLTRPPLLQASAEIEDYEGIAGSYVERTDKGVEIWTQTYGGGPGVQCLTIL